MSTVSACSWQPFVVVWVGSWSSAAIRVLNPEWMVRWLLPPPYAAVAWQMLTATAPSGMRLVCWP
ncbi:MAG: hypothetical protein QOE23_800 [Pseudonocardiales bacterium]|jgi:hypothetical protein|nr:hypothetical protein [Pseudonocardiales bacterium]